MADASNFDVTGSTGPISSVFIPPLVCKYDPTNTKSPFTPLFNVFCTRIDERAGIDPPTANFRYEFDDNLYLNLGFPGRIEDVWPLDASGPYVVQSDDRLVVIGYEPDGSAVYLFDGFAQIPQADFGESGESATFTAVGVAAREFDDPISGRVQRNADPTGIQETDGTDDVQIDLPCRFNPADRSYGDDSGFRPNKTPDNYDTKIGGKALDHPVFVQEGLVRYSDSDGKEKDDTKSAAYWSISDAIKYILAEYNEAQTYTSFQSFDTLDDLLETTYDAADPEGPITEGDITTDPLLIRDYTAANKPWPEAVAEMLGYAGFICRWDLQSDAAGPSSSGKPTTRLRIYRADMMSKTPVKWLYLAKPISDITQTRNNVTDLHLARDSNAIVNAWQVETGQREVEITIWLAPLFKIAASDASASANRTKYKLSELDVSNASADDRRKYRWHGADECGDGHWGNSTKAWKDDNYCDFTPVFPDDPDTGEATWTARYRPADDRLITKDSQGKPLKARLDIAIPGEGWDTVQIRGDDNGYTWFPVERGWRLLNDRLGIQITADDPEEWTTGNDKFPKINGISWWASPPATIRVGSDDVATNGFPPILRLTCVIEDDLRMPITAGKRDGSPTQFARWRVADARDHFRYTSIDKSSVNFGPQGGTGTDPLVVRDDTDAADAHARALRAAHEMPPLAGSVSLPGTIDYYEIGDRISFVSGRAIRLDQSAAQAQDEIVTYPVVVARSFEFEPRVRTTLQLSDLRGEAAAHNAY